MTLCNFGPRTVNERAQAELGWAEPRLLHVLTRGSSGTAFAVLLAVCLAKLSRDAAMFYPNLTEKL